MQQIPLSGKYGEGQFALVDDEDYPLLSRISWCLSDHGYAKCTTIELYMHALIFGFKVKAHGTIDHHDRNRLNNQKYNLRHATKQHQTMNQGKMRGKRKSIYKGVCKRDPKHNLTKPWQASITKKTNGLQKSHFCGYHATEEEAARAYDVKARELFGEYAVLNFPLAGESGTTM